VYILTTEDSSVLIEKILTSDDCHIDQNMYWTLKVNKFCCM
jgi:hypothetical protein